MRESGSAATILGLLADEDRLRVVAALALGARTVEEVAAATSLDVPHAGRALSRLTTGGLVEAVGDGHRDGYRLVREAFREARETLPAPAADESPGESGLGPEADRVLRSFLREGRLVSIPVPRAKRLVVLDYLAGQFELGEAYPEKDVNERLRAFHPDVAALRRYLVDEQFLARRDGFYWRIGGTVDV